MPNGTAEKSETMTNIVINNEQDVLNKLSLINEWYKINLPLSPVPLVINKAIDLIGKDFMEALRMLMSDKSMKAVLNTGLSLASKDASKRVDVSSTQHCREKYIKNIKKNNSDKYDSFPEAVNLPLGK
ncbi:MAG: hypothetical protein GY756_10805 [bacterium]|nr:hypothetical protein [bacterium]